jgi:hypothetical protein
MSGNLIPRPALWHPDRAQMPVMLEDGTYFITRKYLTTINAAVRAAMAQDQMPIFVRGDTARLSPQQIYERQKAQAKVWQMMCAQLLAKLGAIGYYILSRQSLMRLDPTDEGDSLVNWVGTWRPSPGSITGWAFVRGNGNVVNTEPLELIDLQDIFDQQLAAFRGDYEEMLSAGLEERYATPLPTPQLGQEFIDPAILSNNRAPSEHSSYSQDQQSRSSYTSASETSG